MFVSETYELDDCYWIEKGSTISGMYSSSGGTLTLTDGVFTLTRGTATSYFYLDIPKTSLPISDFKDKTMIIKADVIGINTTGYLRMTLFYNNGSWSTGIRADISTTGVFENSIDIPSDASQVRIRFDISGSADDTVTFKDFRILFG